MFQPKMSGRGSFGLTDAAGRYDLAFTHDVQGALLGAHGVQIFTAQDPIIRSDDTSSPGRRELLPSRYNRTSVLTAEVRSGSNTIDFALDSNDTKARGTSGQ